MPKIKYVFCDGEVCEVEVSDEMYAIHEHLLQLEKRNYWKETRRHISLNYLNELGFDFENDGVDPLSVLIRQEDNELVHNLLESLSDKQRKLVEKVFYEKKTLTEIAREENVTQPAITQRLATILKKLKKLL